MADDDELLKPGVIEPEDDEVEELEGLEVEETEDGGAIMTVESAEEPIDPEFYDNLAEALDSVELQSIALGLIEDVKRDQSDREERDKQYEEGIRRTGLGNDAPGGAQFQGASRVVHPMLTEACVDFAARAMKELWPAGGSEGGPVKQHIIGKPTKEKVEKAKRKARHMNWQITRQMKGFRSELEQLLSQVPLAGAQYLKLIWDRRLKRPKPQFVPLDDVFLPYSATSFRSAERKTHRQIITDLEFQRRVTSGMYRDVPVPTALSTDPSGPAQANDKVEGKSASSFNEDGARTIFEIFCDLEIESDKETGGEIAPYVISIDEGTNVVLALYRNWDPRDELREELSWMVEWPFVPWRGAYPIGITHMIGGLSAATTGSLRALLDSAFLQNNPAGVKLKGGSIGGQNVSVQPGQTAEIQGTPNAVDIRQTYMPLPYQGPSPVLFELLGFLVNAGKGVVQTTFEKLADQPANQPVGTTVALIEQGMVVFSEIHARLHQAMADTLDILHRLNQVYLEDDELFDDVGELLAKRADYQGPMDVAPVSDPNIFSETQRMAQVQMVAGRAAVLPQIYDLRKVEELILERTKIPDAKDLLLPRPEPQKLNAVNENLAATMGRPIIVFPDQDHLAHLQVHIDYMMSPMFGMNPLIAPVLLSGMLNHVKDHIAYWYVDSFVKLTSEAAGVDITKLMDNDDEEVGQEFDRMLAAASPMMNKIAMQELQSLPPIIQQAMQVAQQFAPPQMGDPTQAAMMAAQATLKEVERKGQADQLKAQLDNQRLQMDNQRLQIEGMNVQLKQQEQAFKQQLEQARSEMQQRNADAERAAKLMLAEQAEASKQAIAQQQAQVKVETNTADNQTALTIANMEIESGREARQDQMAFDAQQSAVDRQIDQQNAAEDRAFNAEQAERDRQTGIETQQADRMFQAVDKQTEREHRAEQADKDRKFKGTKVGVSTGTGINPNPKK
jgi:hypothetical protein